MATPLTRFDQYRSIVLELGILIPVIDRRDNRGWCCRSGNLAVLYVPRYVKLILTFSVLAIFEPDVVR